MKYEWKQRSDHVCVDLKIANVEIYQFKFELSFHRPILDKSNLFKFELDKILCWFQQMT